MLKHFGYRIGGKKSDLQSRVNGLLQLKGSSKVGAVIQQIPGVSRKFNSLCNIDAKHMEPQYNPYQCNVTFKEATFYTSIYSLVKPTLLCM